MKPYLKINLVLILLLASCRKQLDFPKWDVEGLFPIVSTSLDIQNLVKNHNDSVFKANSDNSLKLAYEGEIFKLEIDTLLNLPDTTIDTTITFFFNLPNIPPGAAIFSKDNKTRYNLGDVQLTEAIIRYGWVEVSFRTTVNATTLMTYELLYANHDGSPLKVTELVPSGILFTKKYFIGDSIDNRGYHLDLRGPAGNGYNTIMTRFLVRTDTAGPVTAINSGDIVSVSTKFIGIIPEYVKGYFGNAAFEADSTQATDVFRNITGGTVDIDSIGLALEVKNGVGVDFQLDINSFSSVNTKNGTTVFLSSNITTLPVNLTRSLENGYGYPPVTPSFYNISLNTGNSNIDKLLENIPNQFGYHFKFTLNPFGNNSLGNDFYYHDSPVAVYLKAEAPLSFAADNLTLADTVDFAFGKGNEKFENNIIKGELILYAANGYPFDASPQLFLMDTLFNILDSLVIPNGQIKAGIAGTDGKVASKTLSAITIPVDLPKIDNLHKARKMLIRIAFTTANTGSFIKIYSDYAIDVKLVGDFKYRMDFTD